MSIPYVGRFLCLCLASYFLLQLALAAIVALAARRVIRRAEQMRPQAGARLLLGLRLLPAAAATLAVLGMCAPSYLWLEREAGVEQVGAGCLAAAMLGAATWAAGAARGARAAIRSRRYLRSCESAVETDAPLLMLTGIFRPRLVVSRGVRQGLTPEQLEAAFRHERAHGLSHDNLKRLLILMAPDAIPFVRGYRGLERGWSRLAEWAADDWAAAGSREQSLAMAAALVRVGRMGAAAQAPALATSLLADAADLSTRVERLLEGGANCDGADLSALATVSLGACAVVLAFYPATLSAVHRLLETLAH